MIIADTVMFSNVVQQSKFVWRSVSSRKQSEIIIIMFLQEWVNHAFCFSPLSLMIFITTTKLLFAVSGAMPASMICFMGISKALLHSLFSLHLSWSIFILQYKQKLAHEKKILWNTCMTLAGSSIWRCCPNEAVYNLCFCNHDCNKNVSEMSSLLKF